MIAERIIESLRICATDSGCKKCAYRGRHAYCFRLQSDAADLIEQQAARIKELEAKVPRWIPVAERLPDVRPNTRKSDAMLVYTRRKLFMVAVWNGIDWLAPMDFWDAWGDEIVYWMPLPGAPKEENDG